MSTIWLQPPGESKDSNHPGRYNGAVVGTHQVSVSTAVAAEYDEQRQLIPGTGIKERVPARYHSPTTLELEVTSGENELDITLQK